TLYQWREKEWSDIKNKYQTTSKNHPLTNSLSMERKRVV
ncbi:MAG: hypothetical protein ACI9CQ_004303, partial [Saprospiraceae bacterium]